MVATVPDDRTLARLQLHRIAVTAPREPIAATWSGAQAPWSRGLWGTFLPERRGSDGPPPAGVDRRR